MISGWADGEVTDTAVRKSQISRDSSAWIVDVLELISVCRLTIRPYLVQIHVVSTETLVSVSPESYCRSRRQCSACYQIPDHRVMSRAKLVRVALKQWNPDEAHRAPRTGKGAI